MPETITARAVLLDMDGTLVDSTSVVERLWLAWAEPHGLDPQTVLNVVHGRQGHQSMAILLPERSHEVNIIENEQMLATESEDIEGVVEIAGAGALLSALAGLPHAIVTSADERLMRARMDAASLGLPDLFVTAESVTASKPSPEGFLRAAELLGVDPVDCVVFEDSEAGVQAGLAAGMQVIGVGAAAASHRPHHVIDDLTAVRVVAAPDGFVLTIG